MTTPRKSKGFKRTSTLLQGQIRRAGESRGFAVTRLLTHWAEIAGSDIAAIARPVEVKYGRQGFGATLTILTTGAQAPMLEMQKEKLREKVNAVYGYNAISRVRITQTAPTGFHDGQVSFDHARKRTETDTAAPNPAVTNDAAQLSGDVNDTALRQALEMLARNVLSKNRT
ncbi:MULTISPECIES: DUF721 domain-containing protein [Sediminimonas]|uniref:DUF721 domain-containing protein n=1 Tax=Sediminimonas TaxID=659427 RepID=UPI00047B5A68|nr:MULTISPECIES: DciA family protein [Sediminimonas]MDR9485332.1 DciA family protein [Sediminimonas sp.]